MYVLPLCRASATGTSRALRRGWEAMESPGRAQPGFPAFQKCVARSGVSAAGCRTLEHARVRHGLGRGAGRPANVMPVHRKPDPLAIDRAERVPDPGERGLVVGAHRVDPVPAKPLSLSVTDLGQVLELEVEKRIWKHGGAGPVDSAAPLTGRTLAALCSDLGEPDRARDAGGERERGRERGVHRLPERVHQLGGHRPRARALSTPRPRNGPRGQGQPARCRPRAHGAAGCTPLGVAQGRGSKAARAVRRGSASLT